MRKNSLVFISVTIVIVILGGVLFYWNSVKKIRLPDKTNELKPSTQDTQCRKTGCSGQICSGKEILTTCEFKPEYACYKNAECKRQSNNQCGFTPTKELQECLEKSKEDN